MSKAHVPLGTDSPQRGQRCKGLEGEPERVGHSKEVGVAGGKCDQGRSGGREACEAGDSPHKVLCSKELTYPKRALVFALDSWEVIGKVCG